ncbi:hypothetical protein ACFLZ9_00500 [Patescibacteria group bacterium]
MMEVKGSAIKNVAGYVKDTFGEAEYQRWLNSLPEESRKIYSSQILVGTWYPYRFANAEPLKKIVELFLDNDPVRAQEIGYYSADKNLTGLYKTFIKMGSVSFMMSKASYMLGTFFRPCQVETVDTDKNHITIRFKEFPEMDNIMENNMLGGMIRSLEVSGCKNVKMVIASSITKGDPYSEFKASWD